MKTQIFLFVAMGLMLSNCTSEIEEVTLENWEPIAALPLVDSSIDVYDVLNEFNHPEEVLILEDGLIALNFKGDLISIDPSELIEFPQQSIEEFLELNSATAMALDLTSDPIPLPISTEFLMDFEPADIRVDEIKLSGGELVFSLTRLQDENVSGNLVIAEIVDESDSPISIQISGASPVGQAEIITTDLTGYSFQPLFFPPDQNLLTVTGELTLENNAANTASPGDFIEIGIELNDLIYESIVGDFGDLTVSLDVDTIEFNLFSGIQGGTFALDEAIVNLDITNSFGLPIEIELGEVVSVNQNTGVETPLLFDDIYLEGQEDLDSEAEEVQFTFDNNNSSINSLFAPAPVLVIFDIVAEANPFGPPSNDDPNFVLDESAMDIGVDVILPLAGYTDEILLVDTIDMELSFDTYEQIDSIEFKLWTETTYPIDVNFQAIFLDENSMVLDSLFESEELIISSAMTNSSGDVLSASSAINYAVFDGPRSEQFNDVRRVVLKAIFDTDQNENQQIVRIKEDQKIDVKLGAKIFGKIEL